MNGNVEQRAQFAESAGRIGERLAFIEADMARCKADVDDLRKDVDALKRFQAWLFGIGTAVGVLAALLANGLKAWLHGP